jgi:hypothetical protein
MNHHLPTSRVALDEGSPKRPARRVGSVRRAFTILLGSLLLLAIAPIAVAQATGQIKGTVIEAAGTHKGIEHVEVLVLTTAHEVARSVETGAGGAYEAAGLTPGNYKVEFRPSFGSAFVGQFFNGKPSFGTAETVLVNEGAATEANAALGEGGKIAGTVIDNHGAPLEGVEVDVEPILESELFFGTSATTDAKGEYAVGGLPPGASYRVAFFPSFGVNLLSRYFNEKPFFSEATPVEVPTEAPVTGINAVLQVGGAVTGRVSDSSNGKPVANVFVSAFDPSQPEASGFAITNANGEYTMVGLLSGSYNIEFFHEGEGGTEYITQTDHGVGVTQGSTTSGINVSLAPKAPANTSSPVASGTPAVGQTLTCSNGSWTGIATIKFTYQWLRDGSAIGSATGSTYVVQAADQGHGLSCEVTATNSKGHASAKSNTLTVPLPPPAPKPPPPPPPLVKLSASSTLVVKGGVARLRISCSAAPCSGSVALVQQVTVKVRKGKKTIKRKKTLVLGNGAYALAAGKSGTAIIRLTKTGKSRLAHARHRRLAVTLVLAVKGGKTIRKTVLLSMPPVRRKIRA